jgi:hypothetical protein
LLSGIEALLLHGETRPYDVSSSQSNQRVFLRQSPFFRPAKRVQKIYGG